jgi:hypothetical protein
VVELGAENFRNLFKSKFTAKLGKLNDDKLYKEMNSILRKSEEKYTIKKVMIGEMGSKEYKWHLASDKERVLSSYSYDNRTSRK